MRAIESTLIGLILLSLATNWFTSGKTSSQRALIVIRPLQGLLILGLAAHLAIEGAHWQMIPAYVALVLTLALTSVGRRRSIGALLSAIVALLLTGSSCGLSVILPMFDLPTPTGSYAIGTQIFSLIDSSRKEDAEPDGTRARELVVQIWYPALSSRAKRAAYRRRSETSMASSYQSVDWTHARIDAPVAYAEGGFPVLLFNPGWNGRRTQDTFLTEELASHGYVVVAIDHPYNSGPVALADGRVIRPVPAPELFDDITSMESVYAIINREVAKETDDTLFVLGKLRQINVDAQSLLAGHLDSSKIAALGYSMGAAVAAEAAHRDTSIRAVLDLDTPLYGEAAKHGIDQPFMILSEELHSSTPEQLSKMTYGQRRDTQMDEQDYAHQLPLLQKLGDYHFSIRGSQHSSFQDAILFSPMQSYSGAGQIAPASMMTIVRAYSVAFFDQALRGIPSPLLAAKSSPYPEVTVQFTSGGSALR